MTGVLTGKVKVFIELLTVTVVSFFLADACYALFFVEPVSVSVETTQKARLLSHSKEPELLSAYDAIVKRNLLDVKNAAPDPEKSSGVLKTPASAISVSKRGFDLLGTVYSNIPSQRRAIVIFNGKQDIYKEGSILSGWEVAEIRRREVILQQEAEKERLLIDDDKDKAGAVASTRTISRNYVKGQLKDMAGLIKSVQLAPGRIGKHKGLMVNGLKRKSFLYDMGLRKKDLLVRANGRALTSFADAASLMTLVDKDEVSLDIVRKGKSQNLTFRLVQ